MKKFEKKYKDGDDGIKLLANAIIEQAVIDYKASRSEGTRRDIERFFRSDWFILLSRGVVNGEEVIAHLREATE